MNYPPASIFARASRRAPRPVPLVAQLPVPPPSAPPPSDEGRRDEGRPAVPGRSAWRLPGLTAVAACAAGGLGCLRGDRGHQGAVAPRPPATGRVAAAS